MNRFLGLISVALLLSSYLSSTLIINNRTGSDISRGSLLIQTDKGTIGIDDNFLSNGTISKDLYGINQIKIYTHRLVQDQSQFVDTNFYNANPADTSLPYDENKNNIVFLYPDYHTLILQKEKVE